MFIEGFDIFYGVITFLLKYEKIIKTSYNNDSWIEIPHFIN